MTESRPSRPLLVDDGTEDQLLELWNRALRSLAARGRSTASLAKLLARKGYPPGAIAKVIQRLTEKGLLDDLAYARNFARSRAAAGIAGHRISRELARNGVARDIAGTAVAETFGSEGFDELSMAEEAATRKMRGLRGLPRPKQRQRLWSHLASRGYSVASIRAAVDRTLTSESANDDR